MSNCEIDVVDLTESLAGDDLSNLADLCCFALRLESTVDWTIALVFTDDQHISALHDQFMGIVGPTDILTFADDEESSGDIVISVGQAERQRHDDNWSLFDELCFLVVHGALHLAGWIDATDKQRVAMLERQRAIIGDFQAHSSSRR